MNWEPKVPENFDEAKELFKEMYDDGTPNGKGVANSMTGILHCRIQQGEPFIKAYENTLRDYLKNTESKDLIK